MKSESHAIQSRKKKIRLRDQRATPMIMETKFSAPDMHVSDNESSSVVLKGQKWIIPYRKIFNQMNIFEGRCQDYSPLCFRWHFWQFLVRTTQSTKFKIKCSMNVFEHGHDKHLSDHRAGKSKIQNTLNTQSRGMVLLTPHCNRE